MKVEKKWFEKAEKDFTAAEINASQGLYEVSAFLSHQAAEKALKAVFVSRFNRLWKIHDLKELAAKLGAGRPLLVKCDALNPHYIATRYPIDVDYTKKMAGAALKDSRKVVEWARKKLTAKQ